MEWIRAKDRFPEYKEYVLIYTPYCKYKHMVAYWNGVHWMSADKEELTINVEYWMTLPALPNGEHDTNNP